VLLLRDAASTNNLRCKSSPIWQHILGTAPYIDGVDAQSCPSRGPVVAPPTRSRSGAERRFAVIASKERIARMIAPCLPCCRVQEEESARHQTREATIDADL